MGLGLGVGMAAARMMAESMAPSQSQAAPQQAQPAAAPDPVATLKKLKDMLDQGLISQTEYDAKKNDILSRM
jgi:membrane protease subunit (stomatin/prohibitin family)